MARLSPVPSVRPLALALLAALSILTAPPVGAAEPTPPPAPTPAAPQSPPEAVDPELAALLASLRSPRSITAELRQVKTLRAFKQPQVATGRVIVAPPRRLRWEYLEPYHAVLVLDGTRGSMRWPDLGRTQRFDLATDPAMAAVFDVITLFLSADPATIAQRFTIQRDPADAAGLSLVPKDPAFRKHIRQITARVDRARGVLDRVRIIEADGDDTLIAFTKLVLDQPVDEALLKP